MPPYRVRFKSGDIIRFMLPMSAAWPAKKKTKMENQPHESKPDISNLLKALEDAVYPDKDTQIWRYGELKKVWGFEGAG
jgi:Holliday junction resolvase RusA-like endonuclease